MPSSQKKRSSGRLSAPVDVDSTKKVKNFEGLQAPILVFVYAPWCGHCTKYKPMWEELENDSNRSINMARVRDDMLSSTSLTERAEPISSYPTVLLIGEDGKAVNFKGDAAAVSQAVPNHGDMDTMRSIVRNAGTPEGKSIMNSSVIEPAAFAEPTKNILTVASGPMTSLPASIPEVEAQHTLPQTVAKFGPTISVPNIAADVVSTEKMKGGSLFETLKTIATRVGPPVVLLAAAAYSQKKRSTRRKVAKRRKSTRRLKSTRRR